MVRDIRFAGLNQRLYRQLKQTIRFISNSYDKAEAGEWDGSQADVLIADIRTQSGAAAVEAAERGGTPVIAVTDDDRASQHPCVAPNATAARLTRVVQSQLPNNTGAQPAFVRLAMTDWMAGHDIDATLHRRTLSLRPSAGRVFAYSQSDLLELAGQLMETGWSFTSPDERDLTRISGLAQMSLDAFYLLAVQDHSDSLPSMSCTDLHLISQPQLAEADQLDHPQRVVDALNQGADNAGEVALKTGVEPRQVNACVLALRAAGRLQLGDDARGNSDQRGRLGRFLAGLGVAPPTAASTAD